VEFYGVNYGFIKLCDFIYEIVYSHAILCDFLIFCGIFDKMYVWQGIGSNWFVNYNE
jgi:hypothetical protein